MYKAELRQTSAPEKGRVVVAVQPGRARGATRDDERAERAVLGPGQGTSLDRRGTESQAGIVAPNDGLAGRSGEAMWLV
ncbi:MAG TPA: hypothetical protein VK425_09050 [Acidimicrobiales bacterium]|nr:hypothetical protein [Acidimicrobiales bacterium]